MTPRPIALLRDLILSVSIAVVLSGPTRAQAPYTCTSCNLCGQPRGFYHGTITADLTTTLTKDGVAKDFKIKAGNNVNGNNLRERRGPVELPPVGAIEIELTGGGAGNTAGLNLGKGAEILIQKDGDSHWRLGSWIPADGNTYHVKRRYPSLVSDQLNNANDADPQIGLPSYSSYASAVKPAVTAMALDLGGGSCLVVNCVLDGSETPTLKFEQANDECNEDGTKFLSADGHGSGICLAEKSSSSPLAYKVFSAPGPVKSDLDDYDTSTMTELKEITLSTPTPTGGFENELKIERDYGGEIVTTIYRGSADTSGFSVELEHEIAGTNRKESYVSAIVSGERTLTHEITEDGVTISKEIETFKLVGDLEVQISHEQISASSESQITNKTYDETLSSRTYGAPLTRQFEVMNGTTPTETGYEKIEYEFQTVGGVDQVIEHVYSPWKGQPTTTLTNFPSTTPTTFAGKVVSTTYEEASHTQPRRILQRVVRLNTMIVDDVEYDYTTSGGNDVLTKTQNFKDGTSLETETESWALDPTGTANDEWAGKPVKITQPDGTEQHFTYSSTSTAETITVITESSSSALVNGKSTKTVTQRNHQFGTVDSEEMHVRIGGAWKLATETAHFYDEAGRLTQTTGNDDVVMLDREYPSWDVVKETDKYGVVAEMTYDNAGRIIERRKKATGGDDVLTEYDYTERTTKTTRKADVGGSPELVTKRTVDEAGRIISIKDEEDHETAYAYSEDTNRQKVTTITKPNGETEIRTYYVGGELRSIGGTGVVHRSYVYDRDPTGPYTEEFLGTTSGTGGRKTVTYRDYAGRVVKSSRDGTGTSKIEQGYVYYSGTATPAQNRGKLHYMTRTGMLGDVVYEYDDFGRLEYTGVEEETGADHDVDLASTERVTRQLTEYVEENTGEYWKRTRNWDYATDNASTARLVSESGTRMNASPVAAESYTIRYLNDVGTKGIVTETKTSATNKTAKSWTVSMTRWKASAFTPGTGGGSSGNRIGYVADTDYENGLVTQQSSFTVQDPVDYGYDDLERQITVENPRTGTVTTTAYWNDETDEGAYKGRVKSVKDALNNETTYYYYADDGWNDSPAGSLMRVKNAEGDSTYYAYSKRGESTHIWGAAQYPQKYGYDAYGMMTTLDTYQDDSAGKQWTNAPSSTLDVPSGFDTAGDTTTWNYDADSGLLTSKKDDTNKGPTYQYHAGTSLISKRTWARGGTAVTDYEYDMHGSIDEIDYSDSTPDVTYTYRRDGFTKYIDDGAGRHTFTETFNTSDFTIEEAVTTYGGHSTLSGFETTSKFNYQGQRTNLDSDWGTATLADLDYTYNNSSRLIRVVDQNATGTYLTTQYVYETDSDLLADRTYHVGDYKTAAQLTTQFSYHSSIDRLSSVSNFTPPGAKVVSSHTYNTHDKMHRRTKATLEDGTYWEYGYNDRGEVEDAERFTSGSTKILGWDEKYEYDAIGNRESNTGNTTQTYTVNSLNQYTSISRGTNDYTVTGRTASTTTPTIDVDSNPQTVSTQTDGNYKYFKADVNSSNPDWDYVYISAGSDTADYYQYVPNQPESLTYDDDGNLIGDSRWTYTWNAENRLIKMETKAAAITAGAPDWTLEFDYDHQGRRIRKELIDDTGSGDYEEKFVYDRWNLIAKVDDTDTPIQTYTWGPDIARNGDQDAGSVGGLIAIHDQTSGGTSHWPSYDGNGNLTALVDSYATGTVTAEYAYDAFGIRRRFSGSFSEDNPFRFSTKYTDEETGLSYYGFRYYDCSLGRWLSQDPIGEDGGTNLVTFIGNDAINFQDFRGLYRYAGTELRALAWPGEATDDGGIGVHRNGRVSFDRYGYTERWFDSEVDVKVKGECCIITEIEFQLGHRVFVAVFMPDDHQFQFELRMDGDTPDDIEHASAHMRMLLSHELAHVAVDKALAEALFPMVEADSTGSGWYKDPTWTQEECQERADQFLDEIHSGFNGVADELGHLFHDDVDDVDGLRMVPQKDINRFIGNQVQEVIQREKDEWKRKLQAGEVFDFW